MACRLVTPGKETIHHRERTPIEYRTASDMGIVKFLDTIGISTIIASLVFLLMTLLLITINAVPVS